MKIAYYKHFLKNEKLNKAIQKLKNGDFSQVKKLTNSQYFRIKVNDEDRIIFTFLKYKNETYIIILEYLENHKYEKSKFLRGRKWSEEDFIFPKKIEEIIYINKNKEFRYLDKFISFSEEQENILNIEPPIIIVGSAGSGKTSILIEKIRDLNEKVLYISLSKNLIENAKNICKYPDNIKFKTFQELFNIENEITFEKFYYFAYNNKIKESRKYFEEFRGVITGNSENKYLSKEEYLNLSIKNSLFLDIEKEEVYIKFNRYLDFLKSNNLIDSNIEKLKSSLKFDLIIIDEVQDFTNSQILAILKTGKNFILSGDSNQVIYSNFFSWSKLKTMLFKTTEDSILNILRENYRNFQKIKDISNKLLKIKQLKFGSIDKESNYLINTVSEKKGDIFFWNSLKIGKEINDKKKDDVTFAIIVFNERSKQIALDTFETSLIFTVQEAKGLEYINVVLFNFVTDEYKIFLEIIKGIEKEDLEKKLKYSRPKDKTDRELDLYKIYINSLYVAFTRGIENLYILEEKSHKIWELLGVVESKKKSLKKTSSRDEDWRKEAEKLKNFGRLEQVKKIEKKLNIPVTPKKLNDEPKREPFKNMSDLKEEALNPDIFNKKAKDELFKIAKRTNEIFILNALCQLNYKSAKDYLEENGRNSNKVIENRFERNSSRELLSVVKKGNVKTAKKLLLNSKLDINQRYKNQKTLVMISAENKNNIKMLKFLIEKGAEINSQDKNDKTLLMQVCEEENIEMIKLIIRNGAYLNIQNNIGETPLIQLCEKGNIEIVKILIESGANINIQDTTQETALMKSCAKENIEIIKLLVQKGANMNIQDANKETALIQSCKIENIEIAELLITNGANLNLQNYFNKTALMESCENKNIEIIELLIKNKADINFQSRLKETALMQACEQEDFKIVELLIKNKAKINLRDKNKKTAFMKICEKENIKMIELLIKNGAHLNIKDKDKKTALMQVCEKKNIEIVELLIKYGANINLKDNKEWTALMYASANGSTEIVEILMKNKANINLSMQLNSL